MILSFRTDRPWQTVQAQIRGCTVCHSVCIFWTHYSVIKPNCSNFRVITANFFGCPNFRIFTVGKVKADTLICSETQGVPMSLLVYLPKIPVGVWEASMLRRKKHGMVMTGIPGGSYGFAWVCRFRCLFADFSLFELNCLPLIRCCLCIVLLE